MSIDAPAPPPPPPPPRDEPVADQVDRPIMEDATAPQDTGSPGERPESTDGGSGPLHPMTDISHGSDAPLTADVSSPDTAPASDPVDRPVVEEAIAPAGPLEREPTRTNGDTPFDHATLENIDKVQGSDAIQADSEGYLDGKRSDTESFQGSAEAHRMSAPDGSDGAPPPPADGLTEPDQTEMEGDPPSNEALPPLRLEGPTEAPGLESPYTMRSLFEEPTLSEFADQQPRSSDGLPTAGQDVVPPNAEFSAWPANSEDTDAWNQLPERVRESFRGEVRMEEFHDGIGRIVDPDSSIDGGYWYRDSDAAENEETWRRDNAVLGQWNSGSSYVHLDGSKAPIKGWVGTTRGTSTSDGGWLPGGKEGIYIPPSEKFKLRDASVSGGKVPWRS
jgi:hypothetical protein